MTHARNNLCRKRSAIGATLMEAILLIVIMSVVVLGSGIAMRALIRVPTANNGYLVAANLMIDKMEQLRSLDFASLKATANSSDTVTVDNVSYARSWTITANPGGAYDANFLEVKVTIGTQSLTTAVCKQ